MKLTLLSIFLAATLIVTDAQADVYCTYSGFVVASRNGDGLTWITGGKVTSSVGENYVNTAFISLCEAPDYSTACKTTVATRNISIALSTALGGKSLTGYFTGVNTCAAVSSYIQPPQFWSVNA